LPNLLCILAETTRIYRHVASFEGASAGGRLLVTEALGRLAEKPATADGIQLVRPFVLQALIRKRPAKAAGRIIAFYFPPRGSSDQNSDEAANHEDREGNVDRDDELSECPDARQRRR
jgi:hypothetical protein